MASNETRNAKTISGSDRPYGPLALFTFVFAPFATGYFLSFLYRSINALIAPDLIVELGATSSTLGLLTAGFFLGFAAMQLPLGIMLDRYGAARVQSVLLLVAALGAFMFAFAPNAATLIVARALIGVGCAGGLMAAFKAIIRWFPPNRLALVNGCYLAVGGLGAMAATKPAEAVLHLTDWRGLFVGLAVLTLFSATLIFLLAPRGDGAENPPAHPPVPVGQPARDPRRPTCHSPTPLAHPTSLSGDRSRPWPPGSIAPISSPPPFSARSHPRSFSVSAPPASLNHPPSHPADPIL